MSRPMTCITKRMEKLIIMVAVLFLHCFKISVDGFLGSTILSNPTTRQKLDPKSILFHNHKSDTDNRNETHPFFQNQEETKKIILSQNAQHQDILFPGYASAPLLDRRTMTSVAASRTLTMIFGGSVTCAALMETPSSQASTMVLSSFTGGDPGQVPSQFSSDVNLPTDDIVDLPLEYIPTLGACVVRYFLFGEAFAAIVDTGSPFLTAPCYCKPYRNRKMFWGCYQPELTKDSGYGNTVEGFDNNYGEYCDLC